MKHLLSFFQHRKIHRTLLVLGALGALYPTTYLFGQVMQSGQYKIQSDSINIGGGSSSSGSYATNDTVGELATGTSNSTSYGLKAGYWQMQEGYLALSSPSDIALTAIGGLAGESSEGTVTWTVTTDTAGGYTMTIVADTTPALQSSDSSFADYTPSTSNPDYTFSIDPTTSAFGFSPEGIDVATRFKDNGSVCNTGTLETSGKCWDGLSTTPKTIVDRNSSNHPSGSTTTVRFRAAAGSAHVQPAGNYAAHITVTATTL